VLIYSVLRENVFRGIAPALVDGHEPAKLDQVAPDLLDADAQVRSEFGLFWKDAPEA
jgi:hypothetical protein